jgi:hypothetical protein
MLHSGQISFEQYKNEKQQDQKQADIKDEAHDEAVKEVVKKQEEAKHNLDVLVKKSTKTLFQAKARPILSLSSVDLIVDIDQVSIRHKDIFGPSRLISISIKDIASVAADIGPLYGSIKIIGVRPGDDTNHEITYLKKDEAIKARRIIQGLIVASKEGIEIAVFEPEQIVEKLETLGQTQAIEQD